MRSLLFEIATVWCCDFCVNVTKERSEFANSPGKAASRRAHGYTCELSRIVIPLGKRVADSERRMFMDNVVNCTIEIYFLIRHFLNATCYYSDKGNFY